jgi:hypothetical protein
MRNESDTLANRLSPEQSRDLRCLAGIMIPASTEYNVPAADDPAIFADIERSLGRDYADVCIALADLRQLAGGSFADLDATKRQEVAGAFLGRETAPLAALSRAVLQCYYRDDRVMQSLGLEPRPPFPKGHVLEQGDWSLLEPVKRRAKLWRDA